MDDCTRDDVVFVIAGDGADRPTFESRLKDHQNVVFLGRIAPDQVQGFLRRCDILFLSTLPSKVWDYGQSMNKIVDYMLAGKFIIAQYTGYPSFINEAGCGVFTDGAGLGECLDAAIDMPAQAVMWLALPVVNGSLNIRATKRWRVTICKKSKAAHEARPSGGGWRLC